LERVFDGNEFISKLLKKLEILCISKKDEVVDAITPLLDSIDATLEINDGVVLFTRTVSTDLGDAEVLVKKGEFSVEIDYEEDLLDEFEEDLFFNGTAEEFESEIEELSEDFNKVVTKLAENDVSILEQLNKIDQEG
jgi:hypothetical protein